MNDFKLSDHFSLSEIVKEDHHELIPLQWYMLQHICMSILEPLRKFASDLVKQDVPFTITSGLRTTEDRDRLKQMGYKPSETSDHDFGQTIELVSPDKIMKFGKYYSYSVGAVDFVPEFGADILFNKLKPYFNHGTRSIDLPGGSITVGQFILEKGEHSYWIHVSNPPSLFFGPPILGLLKRNCFLKSEDNGKSYQIV